MKKLNTLLNSRKSVVVLATALFLFMLVLNFLTPYVADDYVYRISFYDKTPLSSVGDVLQSMYTHSYAMNGRLVSHFLGSLFMLWPKAAFNVANALVYVLLMLGMWKLAGAGVRGGAALFVTVCMAFWYFAPDFGQVALWQLGSVNYLWGLLGGVVFLCPYVFRFTEGREMLPRVWQRALFIVLALPFGMYIEGMSFISILLAVCLLALARVMDKRSLKSWLLAPVIIACIGYCLMMAMPAERNAKQAQLSLAVLIENFGNATEVLKTYGLVLLIVWVVLFVLAVSAKARPKRLALSALFLLGALAANYMLTFASYYVPRSASPVVTLLILAIAVLLAEPARGGCLVIRRCVISVLAVVFSFSLITGAISIWKSYCDFSARETYIREALSAGERDLTLQVVHPTTPYSPFWGLLDLNTETSDTWPNHQMSEYYGADSIIGY